MSSEIINAAHRANGIVERFEMSGLLGFQLAKIALA